MKLFGPERFKVTFDPEKCTAKFSKLANMSIPKLYVVVADGAVIYVGKAQTPMRQRFYGGWKATGKNGYHGYAWRHTHTDADVFVWYQEDDSQEASVNLETIEAEVVFLLRKAGQWPAGQAEIHFHPPGQEHRALPAEVLKALDLKPGPRVPAESV